MNLPTEYPTDSASALIYAVDPVACAEFRASLSVTPLVTFFAHATGSRHGLVVLDLFQARDPGEAARKKALLIPTAHAYLSEKKIDALGYVFVSLGYSADQADERVRKELASGRPIARLSKRTRVVLYCAEHMEAPGGPVTWAYGEREVQATPRLLLPLSVRVLEANPGRIGFGILSGVPSEG